jgi:hypothetical protein
MSAGGTTLVVLIVVGLATLDHERGCGGAPSEAGPDLSKLEAIEVSVARPSKPAKQPQKQHRDPVHKQDLGVSHDDKQPPPDPKKKKPDDKPQKADDNKDGPASSIDDPDEPAGKPTSDIGAFNPNKFGIDDIDAGDEYWRDMKAGVLEAGGDFPTLSEGGKVMGCVHLDPDGKVEDVVIKDNPGGDGASWVDTALKNFKKARNDHPKQVPTRLLPYLNGWICFKFDLSKQS